MRRMIREATNKELDMNDFWSHRKTPGRPENFYKINQTNQI